MQTSLKTAIDIKRYHVTDDGTHYSEKTPSFIISVLENARLNKLRIRIFNGYTAEYPPIMCGPGATEYKIGEAWAGEHNVTGRIGRTMGPIKSPILVHSVRSHGGGLISTDSIVAVKRIGGAWLYRHKDFTTGEWALAERDPDNTDARDTGLFYKVTRNGRIRARFSTRVKAERFIAFMKGERDAK